MFMKSFFESTSDVATAGTTQKSPASSANGSGMTKVSDKQFM